MTRRSGIWAAALLFILAGTRLLGARPEPSFDACFLDKTLRLDCTFVCDAREELVTLDRLVEDGAWAGSTAGLLDPFDNGRYALEVYDGVLGALIFSRGFDTMSGEYATTQPALDGVKRAFRRSLRLPFPKGPVKVVVEKRDRENVLHPILTRVLDPAKDRIIRGGTHGGDETFTILKGGDPHAKVDLVFLSEGYTAADGEKFRTDVRRFTGWLFDLEPYKSAKGEFNVYGVMSVSPDRGVSEPAKGSFKRSALGASFEAFGLERYLLAEEGWAIAERADEVPCDAVVILVNSARYGGGGIYNDYCITTVDNERSRMVFLHEFGHAFAGLADEYYLSDVAYNDFYPKGVEPLEPNITAWLDPAHVKWQDLLSPGVPLPTPWGKAKLEALQAEAAKDRRATAAALAKARADGLDQPSVKAIEEKGKRSAEDTEKRIAAVRKAFGQYDDKVGLFEGAGYTAKGIYRPTIYCLMGNSPKLEFCRVCSRAIQRSIDFTCGK